jgi:hypothetical protein
LGKSELRCLQAGINPVTANMKIKTTRRSLSPLALQAKR